MEKIKEDARKLKHHIDKEGEVSYHIKLFNGVQYQIDVFSFDKLCKNPNKNDNIKFVAKGSKAVTRTVFIPVRNIQEFFILDINPIDLKIKKI